VIVGDDSNDTYICHGCIGDAFLKQEVLRGGRKWKCHFCDKTDVAWVLDELAERVRRVIEEHFNVTPSAPRDEGLMYDNDMHWERRGDPIADVIAKIVGIAPEPAEAVRECLSKKTSNDAFEGGYEAPFGSDTHYEEGRPDTNFFQDNWDIFRREIRTHSRFFGRNTQLIFGIIFGDLASLKTREGMPVIKEILPNEEARFLYRARIAYSESELRAILRDPVKELGPPPSSLARAGRMNAAGISVFYGATEGDTCIAEVRAPVGSYVVVGRFEIIRTIRILDLDGLTKVITDGSWFDPESTARSKRAVFLRHLVEEISRPIMPRDEEFEYLSTQVISEYLASCVEPRIDGIAFHSAQTARQGRNVVLFYDAAGVQPYEIPEGSKADVQMGRFSEGGYDDSIVVREEVPSSKAPEGKSIQVIRHLSRMGLLGEGMPYRTPTLRLNVQTIEVFDIRAVSYQTAKRSISRYRHHANEKPDCT
jgi:hypothetical protein